eukprot:3490017-Prymnesium_polylepis.1
MLVDAAGAVSAGRGEGGIDWDAADGWSSKREACERLLAPHGGKVGVSVSEPLPDELLTCALLLLVPRSDFEALLAEESGAPDEGGACGATSHGKVPVLDRSALEGEPELAAAVVRAIIGAVNVAERRYASDGSAAEGVPAGSARSRRLGMATRLREAE